MIERMYLGSGLGTKLVCGGEQFSGSGCSTVSEGGSLNCNSNVGGGHEDEKRREAEGLAFADSPKTSAKMREVEGRTSRVKVREVHDNCSEARTEAHATEMSGFPHMQRLHACNEIHRQIGRGCWAV